MQVFGVLAALYRTVAINWSSIYPKQLLAYLDFKVIMAEHAIAAAVLSIAYIS